jgi:HSP20 family protein
MFGYSTGFDRDFLNQFERMRREIEAMFEARNGQLRIRPVAAGTYPGINVGVSPKQVDIYVFAAGADPNSLDILLQQDLLTVSGERNIELHQGAQAYRRERFTGSFKRVITLPDDVDPEKVKATYRDGLLHITVQRGEQQQPRKIEVK